MGTYFRLVDAAEGEASGGIRAGLADDSNICPVPQRLFDAIPGSPWAYWVPDTFASFQTLPRLGEVGSGQGWHCR